MVGEFGFVDTAKMTAAVDAVIQTGASGALAWSLRFRTRDGGFYWHSEPAGGNLYKAFHWPGFPSGSDYDELGLMRIMQRKAYEIRGLPVPEPGPPAAPRLLPVEDPGRIAWQGSVGALHYVVERAADPQGPWVTAGDAVDETQVQYWPLFADEAVPSGAWYYRVSAVGPGGRSGPSNVAGPVRVTDVRTWVDNLSDESRLEAKHGRVSIQRRDCRKAKEDAHRLAGSAGDAVVYRVPGEVVSVRVYAFYPGPAGEFVISASGDGRSYLSLGSECESYGAEAAEYGYWTPVRQETGPAPPEARLVRIEFGAEAQLGRVEIRYRK